jgi:hypothetical protein
MAGEYLDARRLAELEQVLAHENAITTPAARRTITLP